MIAEKGTFSGGGVAVGVGVKVGVGCDVAVGGTRVAIVDVAVERGVGDGTAVGAGVSVAIRDTVGDGVTCVTCGPEPGDKMAGETVAALTPPILAMATTIGNRIVAGDSAALTDDIVPATGRWAKFAGISAPPSKVASSTRCAAERRRTSRMNSTLSK